MRISKTAILHILMLFCLWSVCAHKATAQSSLFSIPTTDVVPVKSTYLESDFISHLDSYKSGGVQTYVAKSIYGLRRRIEIGTNVTFQYAGQSEWPIEFQPNAKWQVYNNEANGLSAAVGGVLFMPVNHRAGKDTVGMFYTSLSKQIRAQYGPRLTVGYYQAVGLSAGSKGGALAGFEQKLSGRVNFVVDWISGRNRFGYVSPGFTIALPKRTVFSAAYNIGNEGRKNNSLFVTIGRFF